MQDKKITQNESEVSLLDLLTVIAENLKLLLLGPLLVGLLAYGICFLVPQTYTSEAILALPTPNPATPAAASTAAQAAAMMASPLVLDPVIESLKLAGGKTIHMARKDLTKQVQATVGKDGLLRLNTSAETPQVAQGIGNAIIDAWLKSTVPGKEERADLEKRLEFAKVALDSVEQMLKRLTTEGASELNKPLTRGEAGTAIVAVGELQARYLNEVLTLPRTMKGLSHDVVKQAPTIPTEAVAPRKVWIAVLAALASGILLLLWVFLRQAWRNAALNPLEEKKQTRLVALLGFKSRQL
jgi:Chain length determinant protein